MHVLGAHWSKKAVVLACVALLFAFFALLLMDAGDGARDRAAECLRRWNGRLARRRRTKRTRTARTRALDGADEDANERRSHRIRRVRASRRFLDQCHAGQWDVAASYLDLSRDRRMRNVDACFRRGALRRSQSQARARRGGSVAARRAATRSTAFPCGTDEIGRIRDRWRERARRSASCDAKPRMAKMRVGCFRRAPSGTSTIGTRRSAINSCAGSCPPRCCAKVLTDFWCGSCWPRRLAGLLRDLPRARAVANRRRSVALEDRAKRTHAHDTGRTRIARWRFFLR